MTDQDLTIGAVVDELAQLRARVEAQDTELAELRSQPVARRHLLRGLAGLGAAGAVGVVAAQPAGADDGDNLVLGQGNTSTSTTQLTSSSGDGFATLFLTALDGSHALVATCESTEVEVITVVVDAINGIALGAINESAVMPALTGANNGEGIGIAAATGGDGGQLALSPRDGSALGPPTSGLRWLGEIRLDLEGDLWVCVEGGTPGIWTQLLRDDTTAGRVIPITPIRALDTRATGGRPAGSPAVPGQKKGPLVGGTPLTLDLAGVSPIPATANGVVGNLTVTSPTQAGYLTAAPSGSPTTTSALNFPKSATVANAFTCQLGPDGLTLTAFGVAAMTYHLIVDITAYIT